MDSKNNEAHVLIDMQNINWFRLLDNNRQLVSTANLRICCLSEQNVYYMNHGEDLYVTLQQENNPIICAQFKTHKAFILPHVESGFCAFTIPLDSADLVQLEIILSNISTLIPNRTALAAQNPALINAVSAHCVNIFDTPLIEDDETIHMIKKGGAVLKDGFMWLGQLTAKGVNKAGSYIESKITTTKKVEISDEKKETINKVKDTAKSTLQVTGNILEAILKPLGKAITTQVDDLNKKIEEGDNETLKKIKKVGGATLSATSVAFSGLQSGAIEVGKTLGTNTRNIVEKKYGDDITNTIAGKTENKSEQPSDNIQYPPAPTEESTQRYPVLI